MWLWWAFELCLFFVSRCRGFFLGFCFVAVPAECLEVGVGVVVGASGVVDMVYIEWWGCCAALLAGVLVAVEDSFSG